jgi:hypothetical protein
VAGDQQSPSSCAPPLVEASDFRLVDKCFAFLSIRVLKLAIQCYLVSRAPEVTPLMESQHFQQAELADFALQSLSLKVVRWFTKGGGG